MYTEENSPTERKKKTISRKLRSLHMWPTSPTPLSYKLRLYLAAGKMGLSRRTSYLCTQMGWITPSQYFFSVEMPAKDRETKELRDNLTPLPTRALFREGFSCTPASVSSWERESDLPGEGAEIPGPPRWQQRASGTVSAARVGPLAEVNLYRCELSCCEPAPPLLTKLPCLLPCHNP